MSDGLPAAHPARGFLVALSITVVLAAACMLLVARGSRSTLPRPPLATRLDALEAQLVAPAFRLTNQEGVPFESGMLKGRCWVACFVFTRCSGICARMSATLSGLQQRFGTRQNLRLVSFSVDPEFDTPEVLARYAAQYRARPGFWHLLTGPRQDLHRLCRDGFKLSVERSDEGLITHSSRLALVDGKGRIRAFYDGEEPRELEQLDLDLAYLLDRERP